MVDDCLGSIISLFVSFFVGHPVFPFNILNSIFCIYSEKDSSLSTNKIYHTSNRNAWVHKGMSEYTKSAKSKGLKAAPLSGWLIQHIGHVKMFYFFDENFHKVIRCTYLKGIFTNSFETVYNSYCLMLAAVSPLMDA